MSPAPAVFVHSDGRPALDRDALARNARTLAVELSGHETACPPEQAAEPFGYCINLAAERSHFTVGFCAALLANRPSLLPANQQTGTITDLVDRYANCVVLTDKALAADLDAELNSRHVPLLSLPDVARGHEAVPGQASQPLAFRDTQTAAVVFTSGSTGEPNAIDKPWGTLAGTAELLRRRFLPDARRASIVATVPAQHMYGLETTVMMALCAEVTVHSGRPFYPQDIASALQTMPAPRILVTTPIHLQALVRSGTGLPPLAGVISATAPLDESLAAAAENAWDCPVKEIYGCSEGGSLASRTTTKGDLWHTLDEVVLCREAQQTYVSAPHLASRVELQDELELLSPGNFRLLGRGNDMLNIGGKRASLAHINRVLLAIEGVQDAAVFPREDGERLAALVVTDLDTRAVSRAMSHAIDPVFLPRPLCKVAQIPRNSLGKSTRAMLLSSLRDAECADHD
ncbi:MAG: xanthomonadin biosynthesis 3-hydroxybenozate--AMP ligase XanA2 [Halioglobus sp.]